MSPFQTMRGTGGQGTARTKKRIRGYVSDVQGWHYLAANKTAKDLTTPREGGAER